MDAILCSLSAKRAALLEEDPELLRELLAARHDEDIPGLLDLGHAWHALEILLAEAKHRALADALVARAGKALAAGAAYGGGFILPPARVADIARALADLPDDLVASGYPSLHGKGVHGGYGQEIVGDRDSAWLRSKIEDRRKAEITELTQVLASVTSLYARAAAAKHSMLSVLV